MRILPAQLSDAQEILNLQKAAYTSEAILYNDFTIQPMIQTLEETEEEFKNQTVLKAVFDDKITGSVRAYSKDQTCYIGKVIVHPDNQNQGIGKALVKAIEHQFPTTNRFELFTGYKSEKNIHFYTNQNYKQFKQEKISDTVSIIYLEKLT